MRGPATYNPIIETDGSSSATIIQQKLMITFEISSKKYRLSTFKSSIQWKLIYTVDIQITGRIQIEDV